MRPGKIYTLTNPVGNELFYVGSTRVSLSQRLSVHVNKAFSKPHGNIAGYISRLTLKPVIEEIESFEYISNDDLRRAELYWLIQLKALGFNLVNKSDPFREKDSHFVNVAAYDIEFLKKHTNYIQLVRHQPDTKPSLAVIYKIIQGGRCTRQTYFKLRSLIKELKELDYSNLSARPHNVMIKLTDEQMGRLKSYLSTGIAQAVRDSGLHKTFFYRLLESGSIRFDKISKLKNII